MSALLTTIIPDMPAELHGCHSTSNPHRNYAVTSTELTRLRGCEARCENRQDENIFGDSDEGY